MLSASLPFTDEHVPSFFLFRFPPPQARSDYGRRIREKSTASGREPWSEMRVGDAMQAALLVLGEEDGGSCEGESEKERSNSARQKVCLAEER